MDEHDKRKINTNNINIFKTPDDNTLDRLPYNKIVEE